MGSSDLLQVDNRVKLQVSCRWDRAKLQVDKVKLQVSCRWDRAH